MRLQIIVSDQHENTAIAGGNEGNLVEPIGHAIVADLAARGHQAWYHDPQKHYDSIIAPINTNKPDVILFIHVNAGAGTSPMAVLAVDCSDRSNESWSRALVASIRQQTGSLFPTSAYGTDKGLRGFCYWFYTRVRFHTSFHGKMTVVEMGNMLNKAQATWLRDHPTEMGKAIAQAVAPGTSAPTVKIIAPKAGAKLLQLGDKSADVKHVQQRLMALGFPLPQWGDDSDWGNETQTAFVAFENAVAQAIKAGRVKLSDPKIVWTAKGKCGKWAQGTLEQLTGADLA